MSAQDRSNPAQFLLTGLLLIVAVTFGGGQGGQGDVLAQLLAVALIALLLVSWFRVGTAPPRIAAWALLPLALPLLQLLPLPFSVWDTNPQRHAIATEWLLAGVTAYPHVSLQPVAVERALWSLLPASALFVSVLSLPSTQQRRLLMLAVALAVISVVLGIAQMADGPDSALRFYANTNPTEAVGFFANRNHLATLLVMALPLAIGHTAWLVSERFAGRPVSPLLIIGGIGLAVLLILGIALARSRAGLILGMLAVLLSLPVVLSLRDRRGMRRAVMIIVSVGLVLSVQFALFGILQRLDKDPLDDGRWEFARITAQAAAQHAPFGSGLGTFRKAFQPFEAQSPEGQGDAVVNHAHNDYVELWLEGGWPFAVLFAIGLSAFLIVSWRTWRRHPEMPARDLLLMRMAWVAVLLPLLHSLGDYPLRTTANMSVFALMVAVWLGRVNRGNEMQIDGRA